MGASTQLNKSLKVAVLMMSLLIIAYLFQNCSGEWESAGIIKGENENLFSPPSKILNVKMVDFRLCWDAAGPSGIVNCLEKKGLLPENFSQENINQCFENVGDSKVEVAMCLVSKNMVISNHRSPFQKDIDTCFQNVGVDKIADCLNKKGILPEGSSQADIGMCIDKVGLENVERCLRASGHIPINRVLTQFEARLCLKINGEGEIAKCLEDNQLVDDGLIPEAEINSCIQVVGVDSLIKCLRKKKLIPRALMKSHIAYCVNAKGAAGIADCLDVNGLLPEGVDQAEIDSCVVAVGLDNVIKCLRSRKHIPAIVMQAHIGLCVKHTGSVDNIAACLAANGLLPVMADQTLVNTCIAAGGVTAVRKCFVKNGVLPLVPGQEEISACDKYVDLPSIAACLDLNGVLLAGMTQSLIDSCVTAGGIDKTEICLKNRGVIASLLALRDPVSGVFGQNCVACHSGNNIRGNLNIGSYASISAKIVPGNPGASILYNRMNSAANPMPQSGLLAQADRDKVRLWILQGALNN